MASLTVLAALCGLADCTSEGTAREHIACATTDWTDLTYASTSRNGFTPSPLAWAGREWRVNAGATRRAGMLHSIMLSPGGDRLRIELRDTPQDNSASDRAMVRRAELSGSLYGDDTRLANGVPLWGAFSFVHHSWEDAAEMRDLQGGVFGQIHMGSGVGGSPALAFRRGPDGKMRITTRGQFDSEGTTVFEGDVPFDRVHDLVYRIVLDPAEGAVAVWLDGELIVHRNGISIGHEAATSYWNVGAYFARGISGTVVTEYANHAYPAPVSLEPRVNSAPCWPADRPHR